MVFSNSFDVPAPADVKAISTPLKSSLCCNSFTTISLPRKLYEVPALRDEPNSNNSSIGKFLSAKTRRNSCPTAPLAPTMATFICYLIFYDYSTAWIFQLSLSTDKDVSILKLGKINGFPYISYSNVHFFIKNGAFLYDFSLSRPIISSFFLLLFIHFSNRNRTSEISESWMSADSYPHYRLPIRYWYFLSCWL